MGPSSEGCVSRIKSCCFDYACVECKRYQPKGDFGTRSASFRATLDMQGKEASFDLSFE